MADDLTIPGPQDRKTINSKQAWEVQYWANKFGVTRDQLLEAIRKVGNQVDAVRDCLRRMGLM